MATERLQKVIAQAGLASRRAAEEMIKAGRVRVNGHVTTELGTKVGRNDKVEVDGKRLVAEDLVYLVVHKPRLVVSTLDDPEGRPTVKHLVRHVEARVHPVGRLDFHTSGVLLMTNDGELTHGLLHPRREVPKTYVTKVTGEMQEKDLQRWRDGVELEDGKTAPAEVKLLRHENGKTWLEVTIHEGRNQQIRRMGDATGFPIMRLARLSFAGITAEGLPPGAVRSMTREELVALREAYGVPRKVRATVEVTSNAPVRERKPAKGRDAHRRGGPRERDEDEAPPAERRGPPSDKRRGPPAAAAPAQRRGERRAPFVDKRKGPPAEGERGASAKRGPPTSERRGPSTGERRGPPTGERRGPPAGERRGPPTGERRGPTTTERRGPTTTERRGPPGERRGPPAGERRGPPGAERRGPPGAERRGPPTAKGGASHDAARGGQNGERRGPPRKPGPRPKRS